MADHPLRPATDRRLGGPLPRQLANRTRDPLVAIACEQRPPFLDEPCDPSSSCGISNPLGLLFPSTRQVSHALLTRSPLYSRSKPLFHVRLACLIHAASVRSEPGSNSPVKSSIHLSGGFTIEYDSCAQWLFGNPKPSLLINGSCYYLVFKDQKDRP